MSTPDWDGWNDDGDYEDGNDTGWPAEFRWLYWNHGPKMLALIQDIAHNGIQEPILLGPDWSIWDGHHRIAAAVALGMRTVPVEHAGATERDPADKEKR